MLRKKEVYTNITPIPSYIPRQLAIDILHSHSEIITLNPLVLDHHPVKAPRDCPSDEFYSTWYEIFERIQYVPGIGKMGSGKISFKGVFHDMPWGLQTHIYAPMNIDMRNTYRIAGNQPGEPIETRELGLGAPKEGLYLREDIEIKCNITMVSFVKAQMKAAAKVLVDRLIKKAELLDSGVLHAMMEDGRLKTINPADRTSTLPSEPPQTPGSPYQVPQSPRYRPGSISQHQHNQYQHQSQQYGYGYGQQQVKPTEGHGNSVVMELPGDFYHPPQRDSYLHPPYSPGPPRKRDSSMSEPSTINSPDPNHWRWSGYQSNSSSRPTSYSSDAGGMRSPPPDSKGFATELPTMQETREEHNDGSQAAALKQLEANSYPPEPRYQYKPYNPQDYAGGRYPGGNGNR